MGIHSHLLLMAIFACLVSVVGGVLLKDTPGEQVRAGAAAFASLTAGAIVLGWVLYLFPL